MAAIDVARGDGCAGDGGGSGERQFEDGAGELEGAGLWVFVFNDEVSDVGGGLAAFFEDAPVSAVFRGEEGEGGEEAVGGSYAFEFDGLGELEPDVLALLEGVDAVVDEGDAIFAFRHGAFGFLKVGEEDGDGGNGDAEEVAEGFLLEIAEEGPERFLRGIGLPRRERELRTDGSSELRGLVGGVCVNAREGIDGLRVGVPFVGLFRVFCGFDERQCLASHAVELCEPGGEVGEEQAVAFVLAVCEGFDFLCGLDDVLHGGFQGATVGLSLLVEGGFVGVDEGGEGA